MTANDQLSYETRMRTPQALVAAAAGLLLVGSAVLQLSGPQSKINELTIGLITVHKRFPIDLIGAVLNGLGLCLVAVTLYYLFSITRARNTDLGVWIRYIATSGAIVAAITGIVYAVLVATKANDFVSHGLQTYPEANSLTSGGVFVAVPVVGQFGALLLAIGFVMTSLGAMRVGLLTKFMGYLGIFVGVLVLFPIGSPVPVVQGFWLFALAYLFSGRWPTGMPLAWRSGQAERWPSAAEMREQRVAAAEQRRGRGKPAENGAPRAKENREPVAGPAPARTRAATSKRKRKRRH